MVLTSIVELAVVLSTFVVRLIDEFELIVLTGVVMVLASIVEFAVELSIFVVKLIVRGFPNCTSGLI